MRTYMQYAVIKIVWISMWDSQCVNGPDLQEGELHRHSGTGEATKMKGTPTAQSYALNFNPK